MAVVVFTLPFFIGSLFRFRSVSLTYLCGELLQWAAFQVVAVPAVYFRADFSTLFWIYTSLAAILAGAGICVLIRSRPGKKRPRKSPREWLGKLSPFLVIALAIIAYQMFVYIFGMHLDEDDARWIAEANDALVKNKMLLHNPATGEYIGRFVGEMIKDVFSPWSMHLAWLSRMTGIRAVVIAHTVYPPILLGLCYAAYYEIGRQLFSGKKKRHERGIFLLMVAMINLFMAGNGYTQAVFTLTRIWQGKAVVAAVIIPSILMIVLRMQRPTVSASAKKKGEPADVAHAFGTMKDWLLLTVAGTSSCLLSGMGIAIGLLMIGIYGAYVVARVVIATLRARKGWRFCLTRAAVWIASMAPSIVYGLGYMRLKG